MKKKKKLAFGGAADPVSQYLQLQRQRAGGNPTSIETPGTALAQNEIDQAKAMYAANSNVLTQGLDILGGLGVQVGSSLLSKGLNKMAYGGKTGSLVEVEGNEVGELPDGSLLDFEGPSHEAGGIDAILPGGTEIFADRIKVDGVSMADRKKKRSKQTKKLEDLLAANPTDTILKNTIERNSTVSNSEEAFDMGIQELVGGLLETPKQKFLTGGRIGNPRIGPAFNPIIPEDISAPFLQGMTSTNPFTNTAAVTGEVPNSGLTWGSLMADVNEIDNSSKSGGLFSTAGLPTVGDAVGIAGNLYQAFAPRNLTLQNRAGDTPNTNPYEDFGQDALASLDEAKQLVGQIRDENLQDLDLARESSVRRNRNSARGINTQRALDLATDAGLNESIGNINEAYTNQLLQLLGQETGLQTQIDQAVMGGEAQADLANRQDRDAFFSNLSRDEQAVGEAITRTGSAVNQIKGRATNENFLNMLYNNVEADVLSGKISGKRGLEIMGSGKPTKAQLSDFETAKGYEALGYDKKAWDALPQGTKNFIFVMSNG